MRSRIALLAPIAALLLTGCAQNTETAAPQRASQEVVTPTTTAQDLMTAGSDVRVYIINAPGASGLPDEDGDATETAESLTADVAQVGKTNAGYVQGGITLNITTGGTTPSATGTATGSGTGTQNPNQSTTASPVQDIKPEVTAAAPITIGLPGSATSGSANAGGSGGSVSNPQANPTQTPQYTTLRVPQEYAADLIAMIQSWLAAKTATTQPE